MLAARGLLGHAAMAAAARAFVAAPCAAVARYSTGPGKSALRADLHSNKSWNRNEIAERRPPLTKIVATVGPASDSQETMQALVNNGMRIMRINASHTAPEDISKLVAKLRACHGIHNNSLGSGFNMRAAMIDLAGPEIRVGRFADKDGTLLARGQVVTFTSDTQYAKACTADNLFVDYPKLGQAVEPGRVVLLDDGVIALTVESIDMERGEVKARVQNPGRLRSKKKVNIPDGKIDLPCLTASDLESVREGVRADVEFVAASFVRDEADIKEVREHINLCMRELQKKSTPPLVIAKIECTQAISNFDSILSAADGIMVARGDLGVEIPMEQVTNAQKEMVRRANEAGKPVIVATQMLESMIVNPRPTRAEISDVSNAVYDGADALMLSGESATGAYPVQSVSMMSSVINEAETWKGLSGEADILQPSTTSPPASFLPRDPHYRSWAPRRTLIPANAAVRPRSRDAVLHGLSGAAVLAARELEASVIIVMTLTGRTARFVCSQRPDVPVMCFLPDERVARQLILHRGLHPVVATRHFLWHPAQAALHAEQLGFCAKGDVAVIISVEPSPGLTSLVRDGNRSASLHVVNIG